MPQVTTGLPNSGRTQFFNFQYDDALTTTRGRDLAIDLMTYCDADLSLLAGWFSGRQLDMSPPLHVSIDAIATNKAGNPLADQFIGARWIGAVALPLQIDLYIGEFPVTPGTPTMIGRYLLISEVSEMYMRAFNAHGVNPWFRFSEGNKGEGLSRFLAAKFLQRAYPAAAGIPTLNFPAGSAVWNVTNLWLNSARTNFLEVNDEDITPDPVVGCATLFLFYLHDQLGYSIEEIINAGAGHLSNVYENLTGTSWTDAWPKFSAIVNSHYPNATVSGTFVPSYNPPLDTVFPAPDLVRFTATGQASWAPAQIPPTMTVSVDHAPTVPLAIAITSSDPTIIPDFTLTIPSSTQIASAALTILPQPAGFSSQLVELTATYAGRTLTTAVRVVNPTAAGLPMLVIDVDRSPDPCHPLFLEGDSQVFRVNNLHVFADQIGLKFDWSVDGAAPDATDEETVTVPVLPPAGTDVGVTVTVTSAQGLRAEGSFTFITRVFDLAAADEELRCRLNGLKNLTVSLRPWEPGDGGDQRQLRLRALQEDLRAVTVAVTSVTKSIRSGLKSR
jgi:hypothetical protein